MQVPLHIAFHGLDHSDAIEARVREKAAELERFYDRITAVRVNVEAAQHRRRKGNQYEVKIAIAVPGAEIAVNRKPGDDDTHTDVYVAIRDAFDAAVRRLEDYVRRHRGDVKATHRRDPVEE
jgi:ribosomal subunit interface protein